MKKIRGKITAGKIVKTSIVTALTFTAALIWKDVLLDTINYFFPTTASGIIAKFIMAIGLTVLIVLAIFIFIKTENEVEIVIKKIRKK